MRLLSHLFLISCLMVAGLDCHASSLEVADAFARATTPGATTAAVYCRIYNGSADVITVTGVRSSVGSHAGIHQTVMQGDMMKMQMVADLPLRAGETVQLEPGSFHVMLMGLTSPLRAGDVFSITFELEGGMEVGTEVKVGEPGQMQMPRNE